MKSYSKHLSDTMTETSIETPSISFTRKPEFEYEDNFTCPQSTSVGGVYVLAIGDPHFKVHTLEEMKMYTSRIVQVIQQTKPSFVVVLGDILHDHEKIHTKVLNTAYNFIHRIREIVSVYVIVGNHDYINNKQFLTSNHWMNAMKEWENVTIVDAGHVLHTRYGKFIFCPYVYPGRLIEALDIIDSDWRSARVIFCHQEIYGCKMGAITSIEGDVWNLDYPMIISGHVHDKQRIQANVFYTGSSVQHSFGESHNKTISVCTFEKSIRLEQIHLGLSSKRIVYASIEEVEDLKVPLPKDSNDQVCITVTGSADEFKLFQKTTQYKKLAKDGRIKIKYKAPRIDSVTPDTYVQKSFPTILYELVEDAKCPVLRQLYKEIIDTQ